MLRRSAFRLKLPKLRVGQYNIQQPEGSNFRASQISGRKDHSEVITGVEIQKLEDITPFCSVKAEKGGGCIPGRT